MSSPLLAIVGVIYVIVAIDYFASRQFGMCVAFIAYALANAGFILANLER